MMKLWSYEVFIKYRPTSFFSPEDSGVLFKYSKLTQSCCCTILWIKYAAVCNCSSV